ncbi:hypothetical protein A5647_24340 [Mycobacterium sp. 1100029.7]|nr:hypothetical protein A5647_24340 [Mycobacterium sp. 1100029.7]
MGIEIPAGLQWVSYLAGEKWPQGDETAMFQIGDDWNSSAQQISDLIPKLQQAQSQTASAVTGETASAVADQFQSLLSGDSSIDNLASAMSSLGSLATQTGTQIQYTKLQILSTLGIAAAEIAYALSSVEWTFGASLAWIPPIEAITMAVVRQLVSQLVKRILAAAAEALTKTGLRQLVKDAAVGAVTGAAIGVVQDLAIEAYQIHEGVRSGIDWKQVGEISIGAVVGGAAGAIAHGFISKSLGESTTIGGKALKGAVTHFSVGAIGNVAGGVATGGGLNAEDIFGGAGGGAVSGGIRGGSEHPEGGAHGNDKDISSEKDTSSDMSHDDDDDDASIKTLVEPDPPKLPDGSKDVFVPNGPGPENDSVRPPAAENGTNGSTPPVDDNHVQSAPTPSDAPGDDASTTATGSAATSEPAPVREGNPQFNNGSGAKSDSPQPVRTVSGNGAPSTSTASSTPLAHQPPATPGSRSDVTDSHGTATRSSAGTSDNRPGATPSATESTSRATPPAKPTLQPNRSAAGASVGGRSSTSKPLVVAGTGDRPVTESIKQSESSGASSETGARPTTPSMPDASTARDAEPTSVATPVSSVTTQDDSIARSPVPEQSVESKPIPPELLTADSAFSSSTDDTVIRGGQPEADPASRSPTTTTNAADVTTGAARSIPDTVVDTAHPAPKEDPSRASASTFASPSDSRSKPAPIARIADQLPSQGVLRGVPDDTVPPNRSRSGADADEHPPADGQPHPVLRLRGGAGEGSRFRTNLNEYARRMFGPDNRGGSEDLVRGLQQKAREVESARNQQSHPAQPDEFGLDPFGLRDPSPTPPHLDGVKLAHVPTNSLGGHIHQLDMARHPNDPGPDESEIWSKPAPADGRWFSDNPDHRTAEPLPDPLEMPKVFHSIWLGGAVTDGRKTTDLVRRNLEKLSKVAQGEGMRVVLWTDVPRTEFERSGGDAARMRSWARRHNIALLSPNEVFHVDEPMNLAAEYRLEAAKGTAAGYTAASDILRLEILHRLGGIYTDHDNQVRRLDGLRNLLGAPGFALHSRGEGIPNNSALLAARGHPFVKQYLDKIKSNYKKLQNQLHPEVHGFIDNTAKAQHENYVLRPELVIRRRSVTERTGPFNFRDVTESLSLNDADVPRIRTDQLNMGSAHTWLSTKPLRFTPEQAPKVLQHAISGLIWDLRNREGDLNLAAVAPLIEGLPNPAAGWKAVVEYMQSVPELRAQVQTVTYAYLRPKSSVPLIGDRPRIHQLDLPRSVRETFGLPLRGRITDTEGSWRRAAFAAKIQSGEWGPATRASAPGEGQMSFARSHDNNSDDVLHGLAAGDSAMAELGVGDGEPKPSQELTTGIGHATEIPQSHSTIDQIRTWIGDVNNDGDAAVAPAGPRLANCGPATIVVFDRLSGTPSFGRAYVGGPISNSRHMHELTRDELGEATGLPFEQSTPTQIAKRLVDAGPGTHTVVAIKYRNGEQHSFNAYFDGTQVHALDGQHGTIKSWPPQLDLEKNPVEQWFMGTPPARHQDNLGNSSSPPHQNLSQNALGSLPSNVVREQDSGSVLPNDLVSEPDRPLPSAQLDPSLDLDSVTGIPDGHSAQLRTDNVRLYRDDTRSPSEVFGTGFEALDPTNTNLTTFVLGRPGAFVSTTRDAQLNHLGPPTEARPQVFRYHIEAPGGIDVNPTLPHHQDGHEGEVAFLGGIRRENILGAEQVLDGRPQALRLGSFVHNDYFNPHARNPHFPSEPPRLSTDSPNVSDDDMTPMNTPRARPVSLPTSAEMPESSAGSSASDAEPNSQEHLESGDPAARTLPTPDVLQGLPSEDSQSVQHNEARAGDVDESGHAVHDQAPGGQTNYGPAARLRGGASGADALFGSLRYHAGRMLRTNAHNADSNELIHNLSAEADRVRQQREGAARPAAVAEDRFGPDPFGLRDPAPTPDLLRDVLLADVPTENLGSYFRSLDLAGVGEDKSSGHDEVWSEPTPPDGQWWRPEDLPQDSEPLPSLPPLPDRLEMPKVVHSIWLGGPVTDGRNVTTEVRRNLEELSRKALAEGMRVALWTDVTRNEFEESTGDVAAMRDWAQRHSIMLLNPDEVFHGGEPMRLAPEYRLEGAKGTAAGYTAASDILRLEILHRFGGIYTDGDNEVLDLAGVRDLLRAPGFAAHGTPPVVNTSALLAAREHPFVRSLLDTIGHNYRLRQDQLQPHNHIAFNAREPHVQHYAGVRALKRRSVMERTGPSNLGPARAELGLDEVLPRISEDKIQMASAKSWLSDDPRTFPPEKTGWVLQHAISGLIWDLRNRRGDLNLVAVAPLIRSLHDPAAGWEAVVGYIHRTPQLRLQVQTVTYSRIKFDDSGIEPQGRDEELELPASVRNMLGLPPRGRASDVPGVWRRATFGTRVGSDYWSYAKVDFASGERHQIADTTELEALASHLNNLGDQWRDVEVSVEGGGEAIFNNAGTDRATAVRGYLERRVDNPDITWKNPTSRGPGPTKTPVPPDVLENRRQVIVSWKAKPVGPAGRDFSEIETSEGQSHSPLPADSAPLPQTTTATAGEFFDDDPDEELIWNRWDDDQSTDVLHGVPDDEANAADVGPVRTDVIVGARSDPLPDGHADPRKLFAIPHSDNSIEDVRSWIGDVNSDGDPAVKPSGSRLMNCGPATIAVFDRLSGTPSFGRAYVGERIGESRANHELNRDELSSATGLRLVPSSPEKIAQRLSNEPTGAHTVVTVRYRNGQQHSLNAYFDGTAIHALDGQHGTVKSWPPADLDRENNPVEQWFMGAPFDAHPVSDSDASRDVLRGLPTEDRRLADAPAESGDESDAGSTSDVSETRYWTAPESPSSEHDSVDLSFQHDPSRPPSPSADSAESFVTVPEPEPELEAVEPRSRPVTSLSSSAASVDYGLPVVAKGKQREDAGPVAEPSTPPSAERPEPEPVAEPRDQPDPIPQLPSRIGDNLVLGGTDVVEEFLSDDQALDHIKQLILRHGGEDAWSHNREQVVALFADDALRPKVSGMLRGGRAIKRVYELALGRTLAVDLRLDGASKDSELHFKENVEKYEYEHTSDSTNTVGSSVQSRTVVYGGAQANFTHPDVTITPTLLGLRTHDSALNEVIADRQVSGAQTAEPSTRFHGTVKATITHKLDTVRSVHKPESRDIIYRAQVVVPKRDVDDRGDDGDHGESDASEAHGTVESQPGPSDVHRPAQPSGGPSRVHDTRALSGSDVVTNLWLVPDDLPPAEHDTARPAQQKGARPIEATPQTHVGDDEREREETPPSRVQSPRVRTIPDLLAGDAMQAAFKKAYGKLAVRAVNETDNWLTVERLQSNLHGMTNKQPLVLHFESIPGARLEVHAFIEPIDTPSAVRSSVAPDAKYRTDRLMRATGRTDMTEFHYGTETDTSLARQDAVTWSAEFPTPSRIRGEGGTNSGEFSGGIDANHIRGRIESESDSRRYRIRNTLKNPVAGQGWHGQVRLRFEMHPPDSASSSILAAAFKGSTHETFQGAVHETRARFDALIEESETALVEDYKGKQVWAPPNRIWGGGPPAEHRSIAEAPWWRAGTRHRTVQDSRNAEAPRATEYPALELIPRGEEGVVPSRGMASMDRVTNLDLSGFHGMVNYMGRRAFGGDWANIRDDVSSWYHLNRVRDALPAMTQQSPLSRTQLTGPGSKTKTSLVANFEELKFRRVIEPLSSPSTEAVESSAKTIERNRQTTAQLGLGGRGGDVAGSPVLGEAIIGGQHVARDSERLGEQQRVALATKFDQKMAIFDGWVRLDGYMTGSVATVHESGLFPVEIAIPLSELQGSRIHDDEVRPTFTRDEPAGFVDHPRPKREPDLVDRAPFPKHPDPPKAMGYTHRPGSTRSVLRKPRPGVGGSEAGRVRGGPGDAETQPVGDASAAIASTPAPGPSGPKWKWTQPPTVEDPPKPPPHALQGSWHPSDMVVGVDRNTGLQEAIRQDLATVLGSDLDDAMVGVSNQFGPRVLAARLTHESGRQWTHDIPVAGGHITVKVRPVRENTYAYVSPSEKFEVDMSTEMESSITHGHGTALRTVKGVRLQVPVPHGSISVQVTHTGSVVPKEDTTADADHGVTQLSDVNIPNISGENDYRLPMRVRTTQAHDLFRQPVRFEISYEASLGAKLLSTKVPEEPPPVRLTAVFSYPKHTPSPAGAPEAGQDGEAHDTPPAVHPHLEVKQAVMEVRPHHAPRATDEANASHADVEQHTPSGDAVAVHILDSIADQGVTVFGKDWPAVRAELTGELRTMAVQRDLNDFSRGGTKIIKLKSVRGGEVKLGAHLDTKNVADSDATTEFYNGRQQVLVAAVSRTKVSNWQGYVQAQGDVLPSGDIVNLSVQGQISGALGDETTNTRTETASADTLFRKKVATVSHVGTATIEARMSRPPGRLLGSGAAPLSGVGHAQISYLARESPTDAQDHHVYLPREGIIQTGGRPEGDSADHRDSGGSGPSGAAGSPGQPEPPDSGLPARGLSLDTIVRKVIDGANFRDRTLENMHASLSPREMKEIGDYVGAALHDTRLAGNLPAMSRSENDSDAVELLQHGNFRITGRADVRQLDFKEIEHEGGNAYLLNDVNQAKANQRIKSRQIGWRLLFGPHGRFADMQASLLGGGGTTAQRRYGASFSETARISANAKFARPHAVFDSTTRVTLTVHIGDTAHQLPALDVHGPILIPKSETRISGPESTSDGPAERLAGSVGEPAPIGPAESRAHPVDPDSSHPAPTVEHATQAEQSAGRSLSRMVQGLKGLAHNRFEPGQSLSGARPQALLPSGVAEAAHTAHRTGLPATHTATTRAEPPTTRSADDAEPSID